MRLVTRGDLDGLTCAVILKENEKIDDIFLVHPQFITDKKVEITSNDILANLPYHPACGKWFDHHLLTESNEKPPEKFVGKFGLAQSAAQLVWEYYGKPARFAALVEGTNRLDSANLTSEDVLDPKGFILFGYTIDGRSGLGPYEDYFVRCVDWVSRLPIDEVLRQPEVADRVARLKKENSLFRQALESHSRMEGNVVVTDFRDLAEIPAGNRFIIYTIFPQSNVSLRIHWGPKREFVVAAVGHSIFRRTCKTNVGELMSRYGGGGHKGAGTAPLPVAVAEAKLAEILQTLKKNG
jgi:oligoribonuclease NrnB/cAMP/cGMP phosphodiesterase (DHH superfamily)